MSKKPGNHGTPWTAEQEAQLRKEIGQNTPTRLLSLHLERTPSAIRSKAHDLDLSLKPTNQSPRNPKKR